MVDRPYPHDSSNGARRTWELWLDFQRDGVLEKVAGLDDDAARRAMVTSRTTILGIVRHLAGVEHWWFHCVVAGEAEDPGIAAMDDWDVANATLSEAVALYEREIERSRRIAATVEDLTTTVAASTHSHLDYAWVLSHMVEETARHLGHLDILREQTDELTGR